MTSLKEYARGTLKKFDIGITRVSHLEKLQEHSAAHGDLEFLLRMPDKYSGQIVRLLRESKSQSQLRQDLFVLSQFDFKCGGYFVEFGATNGRFLSNTWLLEKEYGWKGIVAEPGRRWHDGLRKNRTCNIETDCVWRDSNSTLKFNEVEDGEFSTIDNFSEDHFKDQHKALGKRGTRYEVRTISLSDLLAKYNAPTEIDYLSIDTEGSEYEILASFDFSKYRFGVITVEHNFAPRRTLIFDLLTNQGYKRQYEELSHFDDWYVRA
jgi:FkbM family methyltransferase